MLKNKIKKVLPACIIISAFLLFVFSRQRFFENELYIKLFSEDICFNLQKHSVNKAILKEFKRLKKNSHLRIKYIDESSDCLLYSNESDVFRLIEIKNGKIVNNLYEPAFHYEKDGNYVHFTFEDKFLNHVDGILMRLDSNSNENEFYYVPVNTRTEEYNFIIKLNEKNTQNIENYNFSIEYAHWNGSNWILP